MNILEKIISDNIELRAKQKKEISEINMRSQAEDIIVNRGFTRKNSFADALKVEGQATIIAELKKASPSKGLIREDFDPAELAPILEKAGAATLSVLTEPLHFKGSVEYLKTARSLVNIPIIRKDFMVEPYQFHESVVLGADAILLIAAALEPNKYQDLFQLARELGLSVLSEVHSMKELEMIMKHGAQIVGVNARNLKTFETSLELTAEIIQEIPSEFVKVAESGIKTREDVVKLTLQGADSFLIGETLMREKNPELKLKELLGKES